MQVRSRILLQSNETYNKNTVIAGCNLCLLGWASTDVNCSTKLFLVGKLPIYLIVSLGCYGLLMVGVGLMNFPTCPQEALLLQQDITEAKDFLKQKGVDVGSD
ncbi:Dolichol-phosphate mannosyltransferase subunit 3 [Dillenia turbinata]|uniref:Dolichol-phosphate mannosyltransferase subunit 3 n=1 Tax=Dillenia turbinata TaxID=194707 RepID=A0AAN8VUI9_9MAGN